MKNIPIDHPIPKLSVEGKWILPKDAMSSFNKGWYDMNCKPFQLTHKYSVCFISDPSQFCLTNTFNPRENHPRFKDTEENYKQHQDFVQTMIPGGNGKNGFVNFAQSALYKSISDLHERSDKIHFLWGGHQPRTREYVMDLLFRDGGKE